MRGPVADRGSSAHPARSKRENKEMAMTDPNAAPEDIGTDARDDATAAQVLRDTNGGTPGSDAGGGGGMGGQDAADAAAASAAASVGGANAANPVDTGLDTGAADAAAEARARSVADSGPTAR
jgi:hypothetical protein